MTRSGDLALGLNAPADQRIARLVLDLHAVRPPHPWAPRRRRGEAFWTAERLLEAGAHRRRERDRCACGDVRGQPRVQPAGGIARPPAADGVTVNPQQACHVLAVLGLPGDQPIAHVQPGSLLAVVFMV
ncbi:MAG TPA: hypothetical protein VI542_00800 [Candidatus Tectomicrobia bacterium]